jgi:transcription termination/antitermination protein NusG
MFEIDRRELGVAEPAGEEPIVDDTQMGDFAGAVEEPVADEPVVEDSVVEEAAVDAPIEDLVVEESASDELPDVEDAIAPAAEGEAVAPRPKDNRNWFVVHTYSGYENKVKANLERRIHSMGMQDKIFRVLVPMEDEVEFKDGKRKITPKKVFPGYVLVEMIMDDQSWYVVRNTQGVTGFVGSPGPGEKPVPLQDKEVKTILKQMGIEAPKLKIDFKKGDRVKVTSGPFFDFTGIVDEIAPEKERLRALISIFGRETPVELEFFQVEKV